MWPRASITISAPPAARGLRQRGFTAGMVSRATAARNPRRNSRRPTSWRRAWTTLCVSTGPSSSFDAITRPMTAFPQTQVPLRQDPLLQPFQIKKLILKNRVMSTSHAAGLEVDGLPQERYQLYHEEKAKGGIALTMFGGSSNVAPDSPNIFRQLNVGVDEIIPRFQQFSERIHAHGAALMCQITHLGRRGEPYASNWLPTIGPSPIRETLHRSFPKERARHRTRGEGVRRGSPALSRGRARRHRGAWRRASRRPVLVAEDQPAHGFVWGSLENRCRLGLMV